MWSPTSFDRDFAALPIVLIDAATLEDEPVQLGGLPTGEVEGWDIDYSADGRFLTASVDSHDVAELTTTVMVWDVMAPVEPILRFRSPMAWAVALSPDGSRLYVGTHSPATLTVYDVATGRQVDAVETPQMELGTDHASDPADGAGSERRWHHDSRFKTPRASFSSTPARWLNETADRSHRLGADPGVLRRQCVARLRIERRRGDRLGRGDGRGGVKHLGAHTGPVWGLAVRPGRQHAVLGVDRPYAARMGALRRAPVHPADRPGRAGTTPGGVGCA